MSNYLSPYRKLMISAKWALFSNPITNEQGRILVRYLRKWNYVSVHLHLNNISSHTYISEAHGTYSSVDHIIVPKHLLSGFSDCTVLEEDPLNDLPVCASLTCTCKNQVTLLKLLIRDINLTGQCWQRKRFRALTQKWLKRGYLISTAQTFTHSSMTPLLLTHILLTSLRYWFQLLKSALLPNASHLTWNLAGMCNLKLLTLNLNRPTRHGRGQAALVAVTTLPESVTRKPK